MHYEDLACHHSFSNSCDLHTGTTARVRTSQGMSDVFYTTSGVRQGCILAPALFCDTVLVILESMLATSMIHLTDINYTDDTVLFTDDPTKWDYVSRNFEASAGVMGLPHKLAVA